MKDQTVNRRKLLGAFALSTSTVALGGVGLNLESLLLGSEGEEKVKRIIKEHFQIKPSDEVSLRDFYQSLLLAKDHRENQRFFLDHLDRKELEERLQIYVIEEFVVSTNYLAVAGDDKKILKMLSV